MTRSGLMLYTVRRACADDFEATLRAVARMGYAGVELFDLHGHDPQTVRGWLDRLDLTPCGRHASLAAIEADAAGLAAELEILGTDRLVVSWIEPPATGAEARESAARIRAAAAGARATGLRPGFHNHDGELRPLDDGSTLFGLLLETAADELFLEIDLGWAWYAGCDPVALLAEAAGRCPLVHLKDFLSRDAPSYCPLGDGAIEYSSVVAAATAAGVEWLLVEQDETDGPELDAAERSLRALEHLQGSDR